MVHYLFESIQPGQTRHVGWSLVMVGLVLMGSGVVVILFPEILAYLFGGLVFMVGFVLTGIGWRVRRLQRDYASRAQVQIHEDWQE